MVRAGVDVRCFGSDAGGVYVAKGLYGFSRCQNGWNGNPELAALNRSRPYGG